jgi:HK97 family phage major capsid protein
MSAPATTQSEIRLERLLDEQDLNRSKHENLLLSINAREDKTLTETESEHIELYRERAVELDAEIEKLSQDVEGAKKAIEASKAIRRSLAGNTDGVEVDGDGIVYRDFATYAHDFIITRQSQECSKIAQLAGGDKAVLAARERLQLLRTPANTLSSDVGGLQPAQHIDQIFQVIDKSRPLVASANRSTLERGTLTYPKVTQRPVVAVQGTEKTEAGNQAMNVAMETEPASTYLGGGDLSWQAINWSTTDALQLWFDLAAADYALKTEQDAAQALQHSGFTFNVSSTITGTATFAEFLAAVGAGASDVFANSGRMADTVYMAVDRYWYLFGLTSTAIAQFTSVSGEKVGPLNIVPSRGMDAGVIVVGDSNGLLVAETAGAPVELRVVEPAIGGVEVGLIGAFEAVVVDDGAFAMITTAS